MVALSSDLLFILRGLLVFFHYLLSFSSSSEFNP